MDRSILVRLAPYWLPALGAAILPGCASSTKPALPQVQQEVGARGGPTPAWPQTDEDKVSADEAVSMLLQQELTPETAASIAILNNRSLRASFEELGISQADVLAAGRLPNPSLAASVRWPKDSPRFPNVELGASVQILDAFLIPLRTRLATERLTQAARRAANDTLTLAAETKAATYSLEASLALRDRFAGTLATQEAAADLAQRQFDAGNINRLELLDQQVAAQETRLSLDRADADLNQKREKLNRLMSLGDTQIHWTISPALPPIPTSDPAPDDIETVAIGRRLDLAAAKSDVATAQAALALKRKTRFLPATIDLGVDTERDGGGGSASRLTGPTVELSLPVLDQGQADVARLSSEVRRAQATYEGLEADVRSEVREAQNNVTTARKEADFCAQVLLPQRKAILRETLLQYNAMQQNNYQLLMAKERELDAERSLLDTCLEYWLARTELERVAGGRLSAAANTQVTPHS